MQSIYLVLRDYYYQGFNAVLNQRIGMIQKDRNTRQSRIDSRERGSYARYVYATQDTSRMGEARERSNTIILIKHEIWKGTWAL